MTERSGSGFLVAKCWIMSTSEDQIRLEELAEELGQAVRVGAEASRLEGLSTLLGLRCVAARTEGDSDLDRGVAFVSVLVEAIDRLGDGPATGAARALFGIGETRGLSLKDRRDRAAIALDIRATQGWDAFRKGPERRLLGEIAEELYKLETEHRRGPPRPAAAPNGVASHVAQAPAMSVPALTRRSWRWPVIGAVIIAALLATVVFALAHRNCMEVTAKDVRVFAEPDDNKKVLTTWTRGKKFRIDPDGTTGNRYRTTLRNGQYGWVGTNPKYVTPSRDCP